VLYDRAFRATIRPDGTYGSMHTYGYNSNAGDANTLSTPDFNDWNRVKTLHSLLTPEMPLGAGLVIANSYLDDPKNTRFSGSDPFGADEVKTVSRAVELLQNEGLSLPFSANALCLEKWKGSAPLIILNLHRFTEPEIGILRQAAARGMKLVAFGVGQPLPPGAAALFGVTTDGAPATGTKIGEVSGAPIVAAPGRLFIPLDPDKMTPEETRKIAPLLRSALDATLTFPQGTTGYGFISNGRAFIVVEDWLEKPRTVGLRVRGNPRWHKLRAVDVNDHGSLATRRDGGDWVIELPLAPGTGVLVAMEAN